MGGMRPPKQSIFCITVTDVVQVFVVECCHPVVQQVACVVDGKCLADGRVIAAQDVSRALLHGFGQMKIQCGNPARIMRGQLDRNPVVDI